MKWQKKNDEEDDETEYGRTYIYIDQNNLIFIWFSIRKYDLKIENILYKYLYWGHFNKIFIWK